MSTLYKLSPLYIFCLALLSSCASQPPHPAPQDNTATAQLPPANKKIIRVHPRPSAQPPVVVHKPSYPKQYPPSSSPSQPKPKAKVMAKPSPKPSARPSYQNFADWKDDFGRRASAAGYSPFEVQRLLGNAYLNEQVISLDSKQPEFAKMPWEYIDSAVSDTRVNNGRRNFANQQNLLSGLESQYGVNAEIIAAIWGMESAYGAVTGKSDLPSALASLAYDGRRQDFAENQLLALMQLILRGDVYKSQLQGSWAGGMGQTQFIPATWLQEGVDGDGDGRRNPWSTADALSSTASYLRNSGWIRGLAPFYEVQLPASFDYRLIGNKLPYAQWRNYGLRTLDTAYITDNTPLELWLPAGQNGPALLLSQNFDVIKVYNNSSSYALGISLLARAIARQGGLQQTWPRYEQPLSTQQVTNLQQRLTSAGYDTKGIDGVVGSNTRKAFSRWQADNGQIPDGFITQRSAGSLVW